MKKSVCMALALVMILLSMPAMAIPYDIGPISIRTSEKEMSFTLSVDHLPETVLVNMESTMASMMEYSYAILFYDGAHVYEIGSKHFKPLSNPDAEEVDLVNMQNSLFLLEGTSGSYITECAVYTTKHAITWTLTLPVFDFTGQLLDLNPFGITAFGYSISGSATHERESAYFKQSEEGTFEAVTADSIFDIL